MDRRPGTFVRAFDVRPSMIYGEAKYRYEGTFGNFSRYRWIDPTFELKDRIRELKEENRRLRTQLFGPEYKDDAFDDGMGGW